MFRRPRILQRIFRAERAVIDGYETSLEVLAEVLKMRQETIDMMAEVKATRNSADAAVAAFRTYRNNVKAALDDGDIDAIRQMTADLHTSDAALIAAINDNGEPPENKPASAQPSNQFGSTGPEDPNNQTNNAPTNPAGSDASPSETAPDKPLSTTAGSTATDKTVIHDGGESPASIGQTPNAAAPVGNTSAANEVGGASQAPGH